MTQLIIVISKLLISMINALKPFFSSCLHFSITSSPFLISTTPLHLSHPLQDLSQSSLVTLLDPKVPIQEHVWAICILKFFGGNGTIIVSCFPISLSLKSLLSSPVIFLWLHSCDLQASSKIVQFDCSYPICCCCYCR